MTTTTQPDVPKSTLIEFHERTKPYALIIGVYNEGDRFVRQLNALQPYRKLVDIIVADGASTDGATAPDTLKDKARAVIINKDEKRGLSVQYRSAIRYALEQNYSGIIMMDGNGKDGVAAIEQFVAKLEAGYDFVQGSRFMAGGHHENTPLIRVLGIRLVFNPIMNLAGGFHYTDAMNGFKACSCTFLCHPHMQPLREVFVRYNLQYYCNYIAPKLGVRIAEIPVSRRYSLCAGPHSKIVGLRAYVKILGELFGTACGRYNAK